MQREYVMGNGAIALGALAAGVNLVSGYPGTPSSEIIETIQKASKDKNVFANITTRRGHPLASP